MIEEIVKKMSLKEKIGQLNQRLYGWQVYQKKEGKLYLTDYFKSEVARFGSIGWIYGVFPSRSLVGQGRNNGSLGGRITGSQPDDSGLFKRTYSSWNPSFFDRRMSSWSSRISSNNTAGQFQYRG